MNTLGEGKHRVSVEKHQIGPDILLILTGGEQPHLGGVVLCEPGEKTRIISRGTHKDYIVLEPLAEAACEKYQTTVVAVGGIHMKNASKEDIDRIKQNCKELETCI